MGGKKERQVVPSDVGRVGEGRPGPRRSDAVAVILASDVLRWILPKVGAFPRSVRFGLGNRIESGMLDVLEALVSAQYVKGAARTQALGNANTRLQVVRHLARIAQELGLLSEREGKYLMTNLIELGQQVGGWRKASEGTASSSSSSAGPST